MAATEKNNIAGLLLAAGQSTRFGSNKLLHVLAETEQTIAAQAAHNLITVLPNSVAVVRADDAELKRVLANTGIELLDNPEAGQGMSSSIRCGVQHTSNAAGWVIALADMPFVPAVVIEQVIAALSNGVLIAAPEYNGRRGHPVGFAQPLKQELLQLEGDTGARSIIQKYHSDCHIISVASAGVLQDIDVYADLEAADCYQQIQDSR